MALSQRLRTVLKSLKTTKRVVMPQARNRRGKGERNNTNKNELTHIREEDDTRGKTVVEEIYPVRNNDPGYRPDIMTNDKEILAQYREELEIKIKDIFIWALGEAAVTEMTKTIRDNDPNKMSINQLYFLFRLHFIPERNKFHSRAEFFGITRERNETAEDVWTRILQTEKIVNLTTLLQLN